MAAQQISAPTNLVGVRIGPQRYKFEVTSNGVTGSMSARSPDGIRAEPVSINGKVGLVFKDAKGDVIKYVLRER